MSEKTLNFLIKVFFLIAIGALLAMKVEAVANSPAMKYVQYIFMTGFGVTPLLLMMKVVSRISLPMFKGQSISFFENMFVLYYIFLTKEARKEWVDYIEEQKRKSI